MATKLKKMKLTSVDLVRAGANQEADICLYKSADPQEAAEGPTEDEKNIFKRFLAFIRGTPTKAENEPHSPVVKAEEPADIESIYKSALVESIHSIYTDDNLTEIEKKAMAEQSIGQFQERMKDTWDDEWDDDDPEDWNDEWDDDPDDDPEDDRYDDIEEVEVQKFNPNHDPEGKFSSSGGGGGAAPAAGGGAAEHVKTLNSLPKKNGMSKVGYEEIKAYETVLNKIPKGTKLSFRHSAGTDIYEKTSDSERGISWKQTRAPWGRVSNVSSFDLGHWLAGRGVTERGPIELMKSSPDESSVRKFNHNHGADGRFTTSGGGGAAPAAGGSFWSKVDSGTLDQAIKEPGRGAIAQIMRSDLPEDAASPHVTYDVKDVTNIDDQGYGDVKLDYRLGYYVKRDAPINDGQTFNDVYRHEYADVKTKTIRLKVNGGGQGDTKYDKPYHNQARRLAENVGSKKMSGEISAKKVKEAIGRGGTVKEFAGKAYMISPQPSGGIACYTGTKGARGKFNIERFTSGLRTLEDAQMWGVGTILNNN